jgi:hypothetical protein
MLAIQPVIWYIQCGSFLPWTYSQETFHFLKPVLWKTLFGFRKGLFVYTPVLLFSLPVFVILFRQKKKAEAWSLLLALFVLHYCMASWQTWWYSFSLGLRPYIDFYGFFALMLTLVLAAFHRMLKAAVLVLSLFAVVLNLVQTYQYTHYILLGEDMNFMRYKSVFFQTSEKYEGFLQYRKIAEEKDLLPVAVTIPDLQRDTVFTPGEWRGVHAFDLSLNPNNMNRLAYVIEFTPGAGDENPAVYVQCSDTAGNGFYYEQKPLFHINAGQTGRQQVKYYFDVNTQGRNRVKSGVGFVRLNKPVKLHRIWLQVLETGR